MCENLEVAELLMKYGANVNIKNRVRTPPILIFDISLYYNRNCSILSTYYHAKSIPEYDTSGHIL